MDKKTPKELYEEGMNLDKICELKHSNLFIFGLRCTVLIDKDERIKSEKLSAKGAKAMFLGYEGDSNFVVWLLEGGRFLTTPHIRVQEDTTEPGEPPDPRDVVRSLPQHVQKRLRHRPGRKNKEVGVKNDDDNVVSEDETDKEDKGKPVKRKRGRPKKTKPELYTCEAPPEHLVIMDELVKISLIQEGELSTESDDSLDENSNPKREMQSLSFYYTFDFNLEFDLDDFERGFTGSGDCTDLARKAYELMQVQFMLGVEREDLFGTLVYD